MIQMKKDLKTAGKDLKRLTQKTEKMIRQLEKLDKKAQAAKYGILFTGSRRWAKSKVSARVFL